MQHLSAGELADWLAASGPSRPAPMLLDVREPWEYELCHLAGSFLVPMQTVPSRIDELDAEASLVVICHHGVRSLRVATFLESQDFKAIYNLTGGINAWAQTVEPAMCKY